MRRILLGTVLLCTCLEPTQIDVILRSDACARIRLNDGVKIFFTTPDRIDDDALGETGVATKCSSDGLIGDIVVVPSKRPGDVAIRIVADVDGPSSCKKKDNYKGCIVARRILRFVDHTKLVLPIRLDANCVDVECTANTTCVNSGCVPATIEDPNACAKPSGCEPTGDDAGAPRYTIDWMSAGRTSTCMRVSTGEVYCWGYDTQSGVLGLPPGPNLLVPTIVPDLRDMQQISIGATHGCGVDKSGALVCWGKNDFAQLGNGSVDGAAHPVAPNPFIAKVLSVASGYGHTCARAMDSSVSCWGLDDHYQAGNITKPAVLAPWMPTMNASSSTAIAAGKSHSCLLATLGGSGWTVFCWGSNAAHQAGAQVDNPVPNMVAGISTQLLALGDDHSCAGVNGALLCWGGDTIVGSGSAMPVPFPIPSSSMIAGIGVGDHFNCLRVTSGDIFCWGQNDFGQLGDGTVMTRKLGMSLPKVPLPKPAIGMTVGTGHVCAWTKSEAWCWGSAALGQLGNGSTAPVTLPTPVTLPP